MHHQRSRSAVFAVALTAVAVLGPVPVAHATFPGRNGLLAVGGESLSLGCGQRLTISVVRPDGRGIRNVTQTGGCPRKGENRWGPDWSANGKELIYVGDNGLGLMTTPGADLSRIKLPSNFDFYDQDEV